MNEEKRIDNYFDRVKQNPPLQEIEKMNQKLAKAKVETKVEVKKGHRKWIKFTLMTTILALIATAFLIWPSSEAEILRLNESIGQANSKNQIPNLVEYQKQEVVQFENENAKEPEKELEPVVKKLNEKDETKSVKTKILEKEESKPLSIAEKEIEKVPLAIEDIIDPDTIQTIDGKPYIITADQDLLERLGFHFEGEQVYYQNISSDSVKTNFSCIRQRIEEANYIINMNLNFDMHIDSIPVSRNNFYPVVSSYITGSIHSSLDQNPFDLEMVNDTLFPVVVPKGMINDDPNDIVLWFIATNELNELIGESNHPLFKDHQIKYLKELFPKKNFIDYQLNSILDESKFLVLNLEELKKFGYSFSEHEVNIGEKVSVQFLNLECWEGTTKIKVEMGLNNYFLESKYNDFKTEYVELPDLQLRYISSTNGDIIKKYGAENEWNRDQLIPLLIDKDTIDGILDENLVYWFLPTDDFFKQLPDSLYSQIKAEYNYVTAEDKSTLEKPACVYFEECKNTLRVEDFKVYPNPANQQATVSFYLPEEIEGKISLVDLTGRERVVLQPQSYLMAGDHRFDLELSDVNEGIYLITLYSDSGVQTKRLIISK